jgi:short subunit fatty acids transporter
MSLHFIVAALYGLIIAPIVHGFKPWAAGAVGAVVGLVLYFISYAIAGMMMEVPASQREWPSLVIHVIFGIICAETYKGMVRRRRPVPMM